MSFLLVSISFLYFAASSTFGFTGKDHHADRLKVNIPIGNVENNRYNYKRQSKNTTAQDKGSRTEYSECRGPVRQFT